MRRSYVVPMMWVVIEEDGAPGGPLNLNSTKLPRPWSLREFSPFRKNSHGRAGNRTRDLMISSQKLWPLDHEAGHVVLYLVCKSFISPKKCDFLKICQICCKPPKNKFYLPNTTHTWNIFHTSKNNVNLSAIVENMNNCFSDKYR